MSLKELTKKIFSFKPSSVSLLNPFIGLQINSLGDYLGINNTPRETKIVISISTTRENFADLPITLYSLINQSLKPDKIVLWLDEEYEDLANIPYEISQFIKNGLEIKFIKFKGEYTNSYYAFKYYGDSIIVTVKNGIYYPASWLKKLYLSYIAHPEDIHTHKTYQVSIDTEKISILRKQGNKAAQYANFAEPKSGILYPPNCFTKESLREDIYTKASPCSDNVWYWIMALVHNHKIRTVENSFHTIIHNNTLKYIFNAIFNKNIKNNYSFEIENLMKFYKSNVIKKLRKN